MDYENLIQEALDRFNIAQDAYMEQRMEARNDLLFVAGEQWQTPPGAAELRMTVNLLGPFLRQITAEARTANPSIRVVPTGGGADVDLADIRQGLIRHIEQMSDSDAVYQKALWYAVAAGEGYIFIDTDYVSPNSFDQDIKLVACENPEMVFLDPLHTNVAGTDAEWGFIVKDISTEAYRRQFPKSKMADIIGTSSFRALALPNDWASKETIRVAKYWVKEYVTKTLYSIMDPITQEKSTSFEKPPADMVLLQTRKTEVCTVKGYLINAVEVLDETYWPAKNLPIIKVSGENFYVGGQKVQYGAIRHAKDPQRQYNYFVSRQTEMVDLAPKNSFVGATGQFVNNPEKWANANTENYGFLDYTPVALNGSPIPAPNRVSGLDLQAFQGVLQSRAQSLEDLKLVFGLNDASLGAPGNETSGVAIQNRVEQGSRSTYHFFDNFIISLKAVGRQLNEIIPFFLDTEREARIVKPSQEEMTVLLNSQKNKFKYDMSVGEYDVIITTGPAYASKREEAYDALSGIMQALPQAGQVIGDLVASQVDSPIAKLAAARIKATIPPQILAATGEDSKSNDLAPKEQVTQLQSQLAQAQQMIQADKIKIEEQDLKLKQIEDKTALELTKADMSDRLERDKMQDARDMAELEARIRLEELALQRQKLKLSEAQLVTETVLDEKKFALDATMSAHKVNETMHPDKLGIEKVSIGSPNADLSADYVSSDASI